LKKKAQSFLALFVIAMSILVYGIYLYDNWKKIKVEKENYEKETEVINAIKNLKEGGCVNINHYLKISVFSYADKGIVELGPLDYSIKGLTLYSISNFWENELVSYKNTNQTYIFSYIKNGKAYVQIVFPYTFQPKSKKGFVKSICLENNDLKIY
jgi:hypothetical protein